MALDLSIFRRVMRAATLKNLRGALVYMRGRGPRVFLRKVFLKTRHYDESDPYRLWVSLNEPDERGLAKQERTTFTRMPVITLVTLLKGNDEELPARLIESLVAQTYKNWELVIIRFAHDGAPAVHDGRVKVINSPDPVALWKIPRSVAGSCSGAFIGYVASTDEIAPFALFEVVSTINRNKDMDCIYSDNDFISHGGTTRSDPYFKPDWSPDLLRARNYIGNLFLARRELLERIDSLEGGASGGGLLRPDPSVNGHGPHDCTYTEGALPREPSCRKRSDLCRQQRCHRETPEENRFPGTRRSGSHVGHLQDCSSGRG